MCGRYTNTSTAGQLTAALGDVFDGRNAGPAVTERFNVAPTQDVLAIVACAGRAPGSSGPGARAEAARRSTVLRWGLVPHWARDRAEGPLRMRINARAETAHERPAFRELLATHRRRCLLPADGFYEWPRAEGAAQPRRPLHFALADRRPFAFAGLWTTWRPPDGGAPLHSCTILTTAANPPVAAVHDRMPVILAGPEQRAAWLDPALDAVGVAPLLAPLPDGALVGRPASARANDAGHDAPDCLVPDPEQLSLLEA